MNVLLIGSGGREHALAWKIAQSPLLDKLYCAPGNAGIANVANCVDLDVGDHAVIIQFCQKQNVKLVVVGPEVPLVNGLVDDLEKAGIAAFGPSTKAAALEGSKTFTKELCDRKNIPTAQYQHFNNAPKAKAYVRNHSMPVVIKADGLAAGKGVIIAQTVLEASNAIDDCFEGEYGDAGAEIIIEDFLKGEEASMFYLCDGEAALLLGAAQDHKRVGEGDTGPNTGGMGAYSPAAVVDDKVERQVMDEIILPTLEGMREMGAPFKGVLYAGLMIDDDGPKLIEYNVRFGDPECQVLMMRLENDLLPLLMATIDTSLAAQQVVLNPEPALTVVMASIGYPGSYAKGTVILSADGLNGDNCQIFHAGTALQDGNLVAIGGRVLNITSRGKNVGEAQARAYQLVDRIDWPQGFCRRDIGWRAVERENG